MDVLAGPAGQPARRAAGRCRLAPFPFDKQMAAAIADTAGAFDVAVLCAIRLVQYTAEAAAAGRVVVDYVDDPLLELRRKFWRTVNPLRLARRVRTRIGLPRYERAFLPPVRLCTFVSEQDRDGFLCRHPRQAAAFIPNGVDTDYFARPDDRPDRSAESNTIVFTGRMAHFPNFDAARYLANAVAPRILRDRPDAKIQLVGADPPEALRALASGQVEVTGRVDDLRPYLWDARVVILPMRSGTGIKNKLLEAWAAGAAVVTTPLACQGVPARDGENLLVADGAEVLAAATLRLFADEALRGRLAAEGRRVVRQQFPWPQIAARFRDAVQSA